MTKGRRGHGEGSIYQRKDGRWAASISMEGLGRKRKTFYGQTRKEVQEKLNAALHEKKQGVLATSPQQKLQPYLEQWLEDEYEQSVIRLSTYTKYKGMLNNHILPAFGHVQLQKLTPQQVQSFYSQKLKEGLSSSTVHGFHRLLHAALERAVKWRLVSRNICDDVSPPKLKEGEVHPLTKEQAQRLLKAAHGHRLEAMLTLALTTGMRHGELLSLRWDDVDFDKKSLQVSRTVQRLGGYGYVESDPKTAKSRRRIMLPSFVLEVLQEHRRRQEEIRLKADDKWQDKNLVFPNKYGNYCNHEQILHLFHSLLHKAGLPRIRMHDLRHSAATIMLAMGVNPKVIQEILGHSNIGMTMDTYSHVLPSMQQDATGKWDDLFGE